MQLSLIFLLFGAVWILFTDFLFQELAGSDTAVFSKLQLYKGLIFMLISSAVVYIVSRKLFQRQKRLQNDLTEERLRYKNQLAIEVFNAQEGERKKMGEELHDNVNQLLGVVKLYLDHALVNPAAKDEMLKKSSSYVMEVINEIRSLSRALISPTIKDIGLIASLRELIESILQIKDIEINLLIGGFDENKLSEMKKLMVYRILQEQLNNMLKHSRAEHVQIELKQCGDVVYINVEDDGVGFNTSECKIGLGLKNIRNRLELISGEMNLISAPGEGCKMEVSFLSD